jgi:predicted NBD/HSP70 family sugar kinase
MKVLVVDIGGDSVVSIGYPGRVRNNQPVSEPANLGHGWIRFDYGKAFGIPVRMMNDEAMQALGSYRGGMPPGCRAGDNALAFRGGFLLWEKQGRGRSYASR